MSYSSFSRYYDMLMSDVDYSKIADACERVFKELGLTPEIVLDAACGTGSLSIELAKRGYDVIGNDVSIEMLMEARQKAYESGCENCLFLNQSIAELDLYGTIDAAVCSLDSINHITDKKELLDSFRKISLFLHPDGVFIFDVNTVYKHREILGNNSFVLENEEVFCTWQNTLLEDGSTVEINLDFFEEQPDGAYLRTGESFCERAYGTEELETLLSQAEMKVVEVFDGFSFEAPKANTERLLYIVRKK